MKASEKAESLVQRFIYRRTDYVEVEDAKRCALIAVNEILDSHYISLVGVKQKIIDYWQEVKIEIEKL